MTIKDIAQQTGLTVQAVYKRIKAHGVRLDALKDKATGQLTPDGEKVILNLFSADNGADPDGKTPLNQVDNQVENEVEKFKNQVEKLTAEVERLTTEVESLKAERDFLRQTVEREQQLHGLALSKLPPALPPADAEKGKLKGWWSRIRKGGKA